MSKNLEEEKKVFRKMVEIYCKGQKHEEFLCLDCRELAEYADQQIDNCPFGQEKTFCSSCRIHCFKDEKRKTVKKVMGYSGPRMLFHHPIMAIKHALKL